MEQRLTTCVELVESMVNKRGFVSQGKISTTDTETQFISSLRNASYQHEAQLEVAEQLRRKYKRQGKWCELWHSYFMQIELWERVEASSGSNGKDYNDIGEFAKKSRGYQDESLRTIAHHWGQEGLVAQPIKVVQIFGSSRQFAWRTEGQKVYKRWRICSTDLYWTW